MKNKFILLLILFSNVLLAQIPNGYYNAAQGLTGNALKTALHNIIKNHTQVSYANLWSCYPKTDKKLTVKFGIFIVIFLRVHHPMNLFSLQINAGITR